MYVCDDNDNYDFHTILKILRLNCLLVSS